MKRWKLRTNNLSTLWWNPPPAELRSCHSELNECESETEADSFRKVTQNAEKVVHVLWIFMVSHFFLFSWPTPPTKRLLATCHSWRDLLQPSLWVVTPFLLSIEVSPMVKTWDCGGILIQSANEVGLHTHYWLTANLTSPNQLVFQSKSGDEMNTFVRPCWSITLLASC